MRVERTRASRSKGEEESNTPGGDTEGMGLDLPEAARSVLSNEETAVVFSWARITISRRRSGTSPVFYLVLAPFEAAQKRREIGAIESRSALDGLPLRRRMALVVTTSRLVVWRADWRMHNLKDRSGELPLSRIASASRPFVGGGRWKTIQIRTREDAVFQFQVEASSVQPVLAALAS
jgi:hypothetical protein